MTEECLDDRTLLRFFDGAASADERHQIEGHIDACASCRELVSAFADCDPRIPASRRSEDSTLPDRAAAAKTKPGELLGGRFELLELAGAGGMGRVFRARDVESGSAVAVKLLHERADAALARFEVEAR